MNTYGVIISVDWVNTCKVIIGVDCVNTYVVIISVQAEQSQDRLNKSKQQLRSVELTDTDRRSQTCLADQQHVHGVCQQEPLEEGKHFTSPIR